MTFEQRPLVFNDHYFGVPRLNVVDRFGCTFFDLVFENHITILEICYRFGCGLCKNCEWSKRCLLTFSFRGHYISTFSSCFRQKYLLHFCATVMSYRRTRHSTKPAWPQGNLNTFKLVQCVTQSLLKEHLKKVTETHSKEASVCKHNAVISNRVAEVH